MALLAEGLATLGTVIAHFVVDVVLMPLDAGRRRERLPANIAQVFTLLISDWEIMRRAERQQL